MITAQTASLGPLLRPSLLLLARTVESPALGDLSGCDTDATDINALCRLATHAQRGFTQAFGKLQPSVVDNPDCSATALLAFIEDCRQSCEALATSHQQIRQHAHRRPSRQAGLLVQASHDALVIAAHFVADLTRSLCDPAVLRELAGAAAHGLDDASLELGASLPMPENGAELAGWSPMRVAWRQGDVHAALRLADLKPTPMQAMLAQGSERPLPSVPPFHKEVKWGFWAFPDDFSDETNYYLVVDSRTADDIITLMETLNEDQGLTFVIVTHDPAIGARCNRVVHMRDGQIVSEESRR